MQVLSPTTNTNGSPENGDAGWTSRFAFLMATIGFAVGLGNIWRFPYVTGENGGGAFILVYLLCVGAIGIPLLMAELFLGRRGRMSPPGSFRNIARQERLSEHWLLLGGMHLLAAFVIMLVYCVIAGWVLSYLFKAISTGFAGIDAPAASLMFDTLLAEPGAMLFWTILGLVVAGAIIYAGLQAGIERAVSILMPALFVLMLGLAAYNVFVGGVDETIDYLFTVDFSKINASVMLAAVGQAFFSIGVAMAGMMTYGAYLPKSISIPRSVLVIIFADTMVALVAGLVIFPAVFSNGLDPASGPGLIFKTLPVAFSQMPGGYIVSILFFLLLSVAALTSMVGFIEPLTRWLEETKGYPRHKSAIVILIVIGALSVFSILGYNLLSQYTIGGRDINGVMDYFSNQILLPLGGLLMAVFVGWFISPSVARDELGLGDNLFFKLWYLLIRYVVPVAIGVVFVMGVSG